jgi:hypothetical protein
VVPVAAAAVEAWRPRLLVHGPGGWGQQYVGAALLHALEMYTVYSIDMPGLVARAGMSTVEETLMGTIREAAANAPSVLPPPDARAGAYNSTHRARQRARTRCTRY